MSAGEHPASAPAPWVNKGETYWFFLPTPAKLPEGAYAPLENNSFYASREAGTFRGGVGTAMVQIVRYTETPAGPYDELIYIPGKFDAPSGRASLRVTRIYVSTDESTYNGRKNWNIPKHVARFSFTRLNPESEKSPIKIEVFPPSPEGAPAFFSAIATPSSWLPKFPLNTKYLPMDLRMAHPPLPALDPKAYSLVGTEEWVSIVPMMKGKAQFVWYAPGGEGNDGVKAGAYADGVAFPNFTPRALGIFTKDIILDFPVGESVEDKKKK